MPSFPALSSGNYCKYPVRRTRNQSAAVHVFCDLGEQRYHKGLPLTDFVLEYNDLRTVDKEILRSFWYSQAGTAGTSWDATFDGVHYPQCQFTGRFQASKESNGGVWRVTVAFRAIGVPA